jgi:hypothetical protein
VFAVTSTDRNTGCWSSADTKKVQAVIGVMRQRYSLERNLPLFSFGASSGGSFVWGQALRGEIDGAIIQIMSVNAQKKYTSVPVIFSSMPRDLLTAKAMQKDSSTQFQKHPNNSIYEECLPLRVTQAYLQDRVDGISSEAARFITEVLRRHHHIQGFTEATELKIKKTIQREGELWGPNGRYTTEGYLIKDPTQSDWRDALTIEAEKSTETRSILKGLVLTPGRSPLAKSLHRAWAYHEYCSDNIPDNLDWLQRRHSVSGNAGERI